MVPVLVMQLALEFLTAVERMRVRNCGVPFRGLVTKQAIVSSQQAQHLAHNVIPADLMDQLSVYPKSVVRLELDIRLGEKFRLPAVLESLRVLAFHMTAFSVETVDEVGLAILNQSPYITLELTYTGRPIWNQGVLVPMIWPRSKLVQDYGHRITQITVITCTFSTELERLGSLQHLKDSLCSLGEVRLPATVQNLSLLNCGGTDLFVGPTLLTGLVVDNCRRFDFACVNQTLRELTLKIASDDSRSSIAKLIRRLKALTSLTLHNESLRYQDQYISDALRDVIPRLESLTLVLLDLPFGLVFAPKLRTLEAGCRVRDKSQLPFAPQLQCVSIGFSNMFVGQDEVGRFLRSAVTIVLRTGPDFPADILPDGVQNLRLGLHLDDLLGASTRLRHLQTLDFAVERPWKESTEVEFREAFVRTRVRTLSTVLTVLDLAETES
jgi:hypothetical protein